MKLELQWSLTPVNRCTSRLHGDDLRVEVLIVALYYFYNVQHLPRQVRCLEIYNQIPYLIQARLADLFRAYPNLSE